ncbi:MAG: hypoxanthine phosphoribosyltransferase [Bacteroidales bacterium]|jgi:hypoxanthine phosphoribosyltransferase
MERIKLHDKYFVPFIPNEKIKKAVSDIAEKINKDYASCEDVPLLLCVLNGSIIFTGELMQNLNFPCELTSIRLASYEGTSSTGVTKKIMGLNINITGRRLIIIEDIVDTGQTIVDLVRLLNEEGAKEVKVCTLLLKPDIYKQNIKLDYVAMEIDNRFIVGYGLDYNQLGRNYKDIYVLEK